MEDKKSTCTKPKGQRWALLPIGLQSSDAPCRVQQTQCCATSTLP